jgi:response regulator RpfG family c-di-GMP phosphodiesterase
MSCAVLEVGNCSADHAALRQLLQRFSDVQLIRAHDAQQAFKILQTQPIRLILVNRVFDADGSDGIEFIRALQQDQSARSIPVMLISNFDWAQNAAVAAGARHGFGKATLSSPETLKMLAEVLNQ